MGSSVTYEWGIKTGPFRFVIRALQWVFCVSGEFSFGVNGITCTVSLICALTGAYALRLTSGGVRHDLRARPPLLAAS